MRVKYIPQVNDHEQLDYRFDDQVIIVKLTRTEDGQEIAETDTFDFSGLEDGELENVETYLKYPPILSAKKEDGQLSVELLAFISSKETNKQMLFPDWQVIEFGEDQVEDDNGDSGGEEETGSFIENADGR